MPRRAAGDRGDVFGQGVTEASTDVSGNIERPSDDLMARLHLEYPEGHPMFQAFYFGNQGEGVRLDSDEAAVRTAIAWLDEVATKDQPFALWVPLINPHPPFMVEDHWFSLHDRADVPLPIPAADGVGKPGFMAEYRTRYGWDALDEADFREITATYYGMVSRTDEQLGRVVASVDQAGQLDNTIFVYLTDHGEYLGDHGLVEKWPSGLDPSLVRNPLIIAGPGVSEGTVCDAGVELIDILPTFLELAEAEPTHTHFGRSLTGLFADPSESHGDHVFSEGGFSPTDVDLFEAGGWIYQTKTDIQTQMPQLVGKAQAIRSPTHTYIYRQCESDELYLRDTDPHEVVNVLSDPAHADVLTELKGHLLDWLVSTSDVVPWEADPRFPEIPHGWRDR